MSNEEPAKVVEAFGRHHEPYTCTDCGRDRQYYDLLDDSRMVCLFCSTVNAYPLAADVGITERDPHLMASDPELLEIKNALVEWELTQGKIKLDELYVPQEVAQELLEVVQEESSSLDIVVTSALRLFFQSRNKPLVQETMPTLPGLGS
jgi:hypothetical protein